MTLPHPAKTPPPHTVVVDTSILWYRDKAKVVAPEFQEFLVDHRERMDLRFVVPEVVRGELLFQQTTSALKALAKANEQFEKIGGITNKSYSHRVTESRVRREVKERLDSWLEAQGAVVAPVPIDDLDWPGLIEAAIWRKPPFAADEQQPDMEKGFRDALILESVCESCAAYDDWDFAFLCADQLLLETAEDRLAECGYFAAYRSIEDFAAYIRLTEEDLREGFVRSIRGKAARKFYSRDDESSLWYRENLGDQLNERFAAEMEPGEGPGLLTNLFEPKKWEPVRIGRYRLMGTRFDRLEEPRDFHWITKLQYERLFRPVRDDISILFEADWMLTLDIAIHWHAEVRSNAAFYGATVDEIILKDREFSPMARDEAGE